MEFQAQQGSERGDGWVLADVGLDRRSQQVGVGSWMVVAYLKAPVELSASFESGHAQESELTAVASKVVVGDQYYQPPGIGSV